LLVGWTFLCCIAILKIKAVFDIRASLRTRYIFSLDSAGCRRLFAFAVGSDSRRKYFGNSAGFSQDLR